MLLTFFQLILQMQHWCFLLRTQGAIKSAEQDEQQTLQEYREHYFLLQQGKFLV